MIQKKIKSTFKIAVHHAATTFMFFLAFSFFFKDIKGLVDGVFLNLLISVAFLFGVTAFSAYTTNRVYVIQDKNKIVNNATVIYVLIRITLIIMLGFLLSNILGMNTDILLNSSISLLLAGEIAISAAVFYIASKLFLKEESQIQSV